MNIMIKGTKIEITESIHDYVTSKVTSLEKFIHPKTDLDVLAEVEVGLRSRHHKKGDVYRAEINLTVDGKLFRAVSKKSDLFEAVDDVRNGMERQLSRGYGKRQSLFRRGAMKAKDLLRGLRR